MKNKISFTAISSLLVGIISLGLFIKNNQNIESVKAEDQFVLMDAKELYSCGGSSNQTNCELSSDESHIILTTDEGANDPYIYFNKGNFTKYANQSSALEIKIKLPDVTGLSDQNINTNIYYFYNGTHGRVQYDLSLNTDWQIATFSLEGHPVCDEYRLDYFSSIPSGLVGVYYVESIKFIGASITDDITDNQFVYYTDSTCSSSLLSATEASNNGVPNGYTDSIVKFTCKGVTNNFFVDFTIGNFKLNEITSITIRICSIAAVSGKKPELRINKDSNWCFNGKGDFSGDGGYSLASVNNQWHDVVIDTSTFINSTTWETFASTTNSSILGIIPFVYRCNSITDYFYIDSIIVKVDNASSDFTQDGLFTYKTSGTTFEILSNDEMASEGVGSGYIGSVGKMSNGSSGTVTYDFSKSNIKLALIDNIVFRVYAKATYNSSKPKYPEFRFQSVYTSSGSWEVNPPSSTGMAGDGGFSLVSVINTWYDVVIDKTTILHPQEGFSRFKDETDPTRLGKIISMFRCIDNTQSCYIDSITINLKENDGVAPTISYDGSYELTYHAEQKINIPATAYDAQEERYVDLEYIFDKDAIVVDNAITNLGTFSLRVSAKDYYGNESHLDFVITIIEKDETNPLIDLDDEITLLVGTRIDQIHIEKMISDNSGEFEFNVVYSEGTHDKAYKLLLGDHTMTVTAIDGSDNETIKVVILHVVESFVETREIINEDSSYALLDIFVEEYLHMSDVSVENNADTGACLGESGYYALAKTALLNLTATQRAIFATDAKYANAYARLQAWAIANGETISVSEAGLVYSNNIMAINNLTNNIMIIVIVAITLVSAAGLVLFLKKRKHN